MTILSVIKLIHLLGLIMGFGGAILADIIILRGAILRPIEKQTIVSVKNLSHIVFAGLAILWISGVFLVGIRASVDPQVWMNQKIWAKVIIVCILTINGILIHNVALERLAARQSQKLFSKHRPKELAVFSLIAAISSVSWFMPLVLGVATEFNFTVKATLILTVYTALVSVAWITFSAIAYMNADTGNFKQAPQRKYSGMSPVDNGQRQHEMIPFAVASQFRSELDYFKQQMRDQEVRWTAFRNNIQKSVASFDQSLNDLNGLEQSPSWHRIEKQVPHNSKFYTGFPQGPRDEQNRTFRQRHAA
jgi:uncharacterized membrane protein